MQFGISALRNDGTLCSGCVDVQDETAAMRECKRVYRSFVCRGPLVCTVPGHRNHLCMNHIGDTMTFTNLKIWKIPAAASEL